jgi:hypothetical protein
MLTAAFSMAPLRVGLPGCEPVSEISDMLIEARRARPLLALLCANLTSLRGRAIVCCVLLADAPEELSGRKGVLRANLEDSKSSADELFY